MGPGIERFLGVCYGCFRIPIGRSDAQPDRVERTEPCGRSFIAGQHHDPGLASVPKTLRVSEDSFRSIKFRKLIHLSIENYS